MASTEAPAPATAPVAELETKYSNGKDEEQGTIVQAPEKRSYMQWLKEDVDPKECTAQLAAFCFMTGFSDAISFSAVFVWCGFQTGNFIQLSVALARLFEGAPGMRDMTFHKSDQQALCSLLAFNAGAFIGRWGDHIGSHKRIWHTLGSMISALFLMAAALVIWKSGDMGIANARDEPVWTNTLSFVTIAFMSASLGVQGIQGKRLNTQFTTTIVLTTVWIELMNDPGLFHLRNKVITRDHKLIAAGSLFIGGFVSRAILFKLGPAGTLGVGCGIRVLIALSWLFVAAKPKKNAQKK